MATIEESLAVADAARKVALADDASPVVRARFQALQDLADFARRLRDDKAVAAIASRNAELEADNKRLSGEWKAMDGEARRLRFDLFDIQTIAADAAAKAGESDAVFFKRIAAKAEAARLGKGA
jgi:hypothetical protein